MPCTLYDHYHDAGAADTLLVLLPCAYASPRDFIAHGFVAAVRTRSIEADIIIMDMPAAHYTCGQVVEYLQHNIIRPARANGYRHIWMIGISLGGYGAALYSQQYGECIDGVFLIAPFLGHRGLVAQIARIGFSEWQSVYYDVNDNNCQLWAWLTNYGNIPQQHPPLYLAYGLQDKFNVSHRLLASILPADCVYTIEGAHDWRTWHTLWEHFLDQQCWSSQ